MELQAETGAIGAPEKPANEIQQLLNKLRLYLKSLIWNALFYTIKNRWRLRIAISAQHFEGLALIRTLE